MKYSLIAFTSMLLLSSCSWYRDLERSLVEDDEKKMRASRTVPRAQYDQLLVKYEELSKKYETLKEKPASSQDSLIDELQKTHAGVETVNVFDSAPAPSSTPSVIEVPADIESQLSLYRRGLALKQSNPGEATKIFQQLETQAIPAVRARAKYQIGDMLLSKEQYDLALQVFEDVINKNAGSGIVLDALRGAVTASDKLGINNKKDQYASMLNDVFESR